jgi:replication-associated recombination protein RarA
MLDQVQWDPQAVKRLEDIVGNQEIWRPLAEDIRKNTCPHIVLCGPAGCGKSLFTRLVLEREKRVPVLHIECTANSGLRDMRDAIRGFARGSRTGAGDYRWIVLEHADSLAGDTQAFLRRMMETTSNSTRFLFECSDAGAISEPVLSRSTLYVINAPTETEIRSEIQRRTEYTLSTDAVDAIHALSANNVRNALYYALAVRWTGLDCVGTYEKYRDILKAAPKTADDSAWLQWAICADKECRILGLDCRDLLMFGWPTNPHISYMRNQWSRLGGISSRALFFRAVRTLRNPA